MEVVFINVPLIRWVKGDNYWTKPKWVRLRVDNIDNYQEYRLDKLQREHTGGPVTKLMLRRAIEVESDEKKPGESNEPRGLLLLTIATDPVVLDDLLGTHKVQ